MKFAIGLAAAFAFGAIHMVATPAMAQGGKSTMETGSNASDTKGAGMGKMSGGKMSGDKMSGGGMKSKKMKKGKM